MMFCDEEENEEIDLSNKFDDTWGLDGSAF